MRKYKNKIKKIKDIKNNVKLKKFSKLHHNSRVRRQSGSMTLWNAFSVSVLYSKSLVRMCFWNHCDHQGEGWEFLWIASDCTRPKSHSLAVKKENLLTTQLWSSQICADIFFSFFSILCHCILVTFRLAISFLSHWCVRGVWFFFLNAPNWPFTYRFPPWQTQLS